jgi:hypothetical protein
MTKLFLLETVREQKALESQGPLISGLEDLLAQAKAGTICGVCFATISSDRQSVAVGGLQNDSCGAHELLGASQLLTDYILRTIRRFA